MLAGISAPLAVVKYRQGVVRRTYCERTMQLRIPAPLREPHRLEATFLLSTGPTLSRYQTPLLPRSARLMIGR